MLYGTYLGLRSIMFEKSCLLPNIEALYINSPVPPCKERDPTDSRNRLVGKEV